MLAYERPSLARGSLEWEIQKFLATGELGDTVSALPTDQLVRITANAVEGQAKLQWHGPMMQAQKDLRIERHNSRCYQNELVTARKAIEERGGCWSRAILLATRLFGRVGLSRLIASP